MGILRFLILSDLHIEFECDDWGSRSGAPTRWLAKTPWPDPLSYDAVILAGDIHTARQVVPWAVRTFHTPVYFVPGNHEFYGHQMDHAIERMRRDAAGTNVHVLSQNSVYLPSIRILGATLWTDFQLYGTPDESLRFARHSMRDFSVIRRTALERLTPELSALLHIQDSCWLRDQLMEPFEGKTIVITHHLPSAKCIDPIYCGNRLSPAFASHCDALIEQGRPALWVHGHTHHSLDICIHDTRVICNPRGYYIQAENREFKPHLVIEIET